MALLREVKYFDALQIKVPEKAHGVFAKGETLRGYVMSLNHIVEQYNTFRTNVLPVERPLITQRLAQIDECCQKATIAQLLIL